MSNQGKENELHSQKKQNSPSAAKDNPETDIYENPIEKQPQVNNDDKANEDPA